MRHLLDQPPKRDIKMRNYLTEFFKDFEYDTEDAEHLLCAYGKITADARACRILDEALAAYGESIDIDYEEQILKRSKEISNIIEIHPYTTDLLLFICMTKRLEQVYAERGLDMQIYHDSVLDLKWKLEECKTVRGICGSFVAFWFPRFFSLKCFALGRLQFEVTLMKCDYEKNGIRLEKDKSRVINVHIPRTGTPMDKESCDKAYALAREFFKDQVDVCAFVCHSWLLFPKNLEILPAHTNTCKFISEFDIMDWGYNEGQDLWRLFDTHEMNPNRLPTNGSLRRCYAEHLKAGGRVGWGYGIKF